MDMWTYLVKCLVNPGFSFWGPSRAVPGPSV